MYDIQKDIHSAKESAENQIALLTKEKTELFVSILYWIEMQSTINAEMREQSQKNAETIVLLVQCSLALEREGGGDRGAQEQIEIVSRCE